MELNPQWLSTALMSIGDGIIITDRENKIIFLNLAAESLTGWKYKEAQGKSIELIFNIYNEQTQGRIENPIRKFLIEGVASDIENDKFLIAKNGMLIPMDSKGAEIIDDKGRKIGIIIIFRDITKYKNIEKALRRNEKRFKDVAENILAWVWEVDVNGKYTYSSSVIEKILGYKPEEILEMHFYDMFHPEGREERKKAAFDTFAKKKPFREFIARYLHKNGETVWLSTSGIAILGEKGELLGYRGADIDITEHKNVEARLNLLSSIAEQSTEGIALSDLEGNLIFVNNAFADMHGYTSDELIGKHLSIFHALEQLPIVDAANQQIQEKGEFNGEIWHLRQNKTVFPSLMHNSLLRDEKGNPIGMIGTIRDMTKQKLAEKRLRESEKKLRKQNIKLKNLDGIKNDFITIVAHELKTPIISIRGYPDYILMKHKDLDQEIREDLERVKKNAIRLETHVNQLLEIMKIDSQDINLVLKKDNIHDIIENCSSEFDLIIKTKEINLENNVNTNLFLKIDAFRIYQVFSNLLFNAIKFTPSSGKIKISAKNVGKEYLFQIKDSGTGLTKDEIKLLFNKFLTIEKDLKNISAFKKSSGLGLYIAKKIVKAHGGRIWIESEGKGKGTEVFFTIPLFRT